MADTVAGSASFDATDGRWATSWWPRDWRGAGMGRGAVGVADLWGVGRRWRAPKVVGQATKTVTPGDWPQRVLHCCRPDMWRSP